MVSREQADSTRADQPPSFVGSRSRLDERAFLGLPAADRQAGLHLLRQQFDQRQAIFHELGGSGELSPQLSRRAAETYRVYANDYWRHRRIVDPLLQPTGGYASLSSHISNYPVGYQTFLLCGAILWHVRSVSDRFGPNLSIDGRVRSETTYGGVIDLDCPALDDNGWPSRRSGRIKVAIPVHYRGHLVELDWMRDFRYSCLLADRPANLQPGADYLGVYKLGGNCRVSNSVSFDLLQSATLYLAADRLQQELSGELKPCPQSVDDVPDSGERIKDWWDYCKSAENNC